MLALFLVLGGALRDVDLQMLWTSCRCLAPSRIRIACPDPGCRAAAYGDAAELPFLTRIDEREEVVSKGRQYSIRARLLSGQLQSADFRPSAEMLARIEPQLADLGVDPAWLADSPSTVRYRWSRAAVLWTLVQEWTKARGYSRYVTQRKAQYDDICTRLESLGRCWMRCRCASSSRRPNARSAKALQRKVRKDVDQLHEAVCGLRQQRTCSTANGTLRNAMLPSRSLASAACRMLVAA